MKQLIELLARIAGTLLALASIVIAPILIIFILLNPPKEYHAKSE